MFIGADSVDSVALQHVFLMVRPEGSPSSGTSYFSRSIVLNHSTK